MLKWGKEEEDNSRGVNVEEREGDVKCTYGGGFGVFESKGKKGRAAGQ